MQYKPKLPKAGRVLVNPSVLSSDFARLADEVNLVESIGVEIVHLDVMDGHFVPNITFGPPVIKKLRKHSDIFFDAHLMITDPDKYLDAFIDAGANHITFHVEAHGEPMDIINRLHDAGCSAGLCINPETPVNAIADYAEKCDMILVMTVHPGFGGQKFMEDAARKIIDVRKMVGPDIRVEVDGGIDPTTAAKVVSYGADTLVAGNAIFGQEDRKAAIESILNAAS